MRPGNSEIILRILVKTHEISNQRRFGLLCPLQYIVNYSMGVTQEFLNGQDVILSRLTSYQVGMSKMNQ